MKGFNSPALQRARPSEAWTGHPRERKVHHLTIYLLPQRSQTVFPICGPAFVMCDGHNAHCGRFIPINDGKRESVQDEAACSVLIRRPALRPLGQIFERIVNLGKESGTRLIISLPVPSFGCLNLLPCLWMETVRLTWWHLTAGPPGGGVLLRMESSELCQSRCPRYGA